MSVNLKKELEPMAQKSHYQTVFSSPALRTEFRKFLENIFLRLDSNKFFSLIDEIMKSAKTDEEIYLSLSKRITEARGSVFKTTYCALLSLFRQKKVLKGQIGELLGKRHPVKGLVEIGFPGRFIRPIQKICDVSGQVTAIHPKETGTDLIQSGFPRPYHKFIPLNEYEPIGREKIKSGSVDLVTCFIGLHHVPPSKLQEYLHSIHRILAPGGSFILRDHNAFGERMIALVSVVHSVFNAATGVTPEDEKEEVRHFLPMQTWERLLEENGFKRVSNPLIREGDPTDNSLVRFVKRATIEEKKLREIENSLEKREGYQRSLMNTYLTASEWRSVEMSRDYASHLKGGNPFYQFSYFKEIQLFWDVFIKSYSAAREQHSFLEVITSEWMMNSLFIGMFSTFEFLCSGMISLPFSWIQGKSDSTVQKQIGNIMDEYAKFIEHTPFYNFPHFKQIKPLWEAFLYSKTERSLTDLLTVITESMHLIGRGILSAPIGWVLNAPQIQESRTIQMLINDPNERVCELDSRIEVKESFPDCSYKRVEVPRYHPFGEIVQKLSNSKGVEIVKIAGQELIQVKVCLESEKKAELLRDLKGCRILYHYPNRQKPKHEYVELEVDVSSLKKVIPTLQKRGVELSYFHDF